MWVLVNQSDRWCHWSRPNRRSCFSSVSRGTVSLNMLWDGGAFVGWCVGGSDRVPQHNRDYTTMSAELMRFIQHEIDFYIDHFSQLGDGETWWGVGQEGGTSKYNLLGLSQKISFNLWVARRGELWLKILLVYDSCSEHSQALLALYICLSVLVLVQVKREIEIGRKIKNT